MQNFSCASVSASDEKVYNLLDIRDGNTYRVMKMRNNRCWMIDNLKIENVTIDSSDSDLSEGSFVVTKSASSTSEFATSSTDKTSNHVYIDEVDYTDSKYGRKNFTSGYYTWHVATAGSGDNLSYGEAPNSICPKGWKLPTSNNGDFGSIMSAYGIVWGSVDSNATSSDMLRGAPLHFTYSGYVSYVRGTMDGQMNNGDGYYWSSTAYSDVRAYLMTFHSDKVYPSSNGGRASGNTIRCIDRQ